MDSLERKLERLSQEERREVEDFADFLLQRRNGQFSIQAGSAPRSSPPTVRQPAPPVQDPSVAAEPVQVYDMIRNGDAAPQAPQEDPVTLLMQEIAIDDGFDSDYMDYGKFEKPPKPAPPAPSPATEAVQRVKEKLNAKQKNRPEKKMLDWID